MAEKVDIWMPMYVAEYLADTMHLSCEESGAYLHLLFHSWKVGTLPNDSEQLRRIARVERKPWPAVWKAVKGFWTETDGGLVQGRLEHERNAWADKKEKNVAKAKAAVAAREARREAERISKQTSGSSTRSSPRSPQDDLESIPSSSSSPDSSYEESLSGRERPEPAPVNLNPVALEIACAHPAALARSLRSTEIPVEDVVAVVAAIRLEAREQGISDDAAAMGLLGFTRSYAAAVALWPPGEQRFVLPIAKFFTSFEYRKDPETWRRDGTHRQHGKQQHGTRTRTAAEERHRDGLGQIASAFPELAGLGRHGSADGAGEGELRDADFASGMGGGDAVTLDGHSGAVWHGRPS